MKTKAFLFCAAFLSMTMVASCSDDDNDAPVQDPTIEEGKDGKDSTLVSTVLAGEVSGSLTANTTYQVTGHLIVPEGKSLTIPEGVELVFDTKGVGANHVAIEFIVKGNLYSLGTAEHPVVMSIAEEKRIEANIFNEDEMWGGIVAYPQCAEMLIDHTIIEYTGGQVVEGSPAADAKIYTAGDDAYPQITTNNSNGNYVITNSVIRYGWSDGIYMMGGNAIIANNIFAANGYDGAEAVNVKAGCVVDVAGNIMYSPNTNGLKLSSDGQSETRGQGKVQAYNNTVFNAGWRRDGEKGGCVYAEKNVLANVFNNLFVNCKFRAQTANWKDPNNVEEGYDSHSVIDYNCYASGSQESDLIYVAQWDEEEQEYEKVSNARYAWQGYNYAHKNYHIEDKVIENADGTSFTVPAIDSHSLIATEDNLYDPLFVNYDIHTALMSQVAYDEAWDFHLTAASPLLSGAYSGNDSFAQPYFAGGLTVNGVSYKSPAVESHYGAFGVNQ